MIVAPILQIHHVALKILGGRGTTCTFYLVQGCAAWRWLKYSWNNNEIKYSVCIRVPISHPICPPGFRELDILAKFNPIAENFQHNPSICNIYLHKSFGQVQVPVWHEKRGFLDVASLLANTRLTTTTSKSWMTSNKKYSLTPTIPLYCLSGKSNSHPGPCHFARKALGLLIIDTLLPPISKCIVRSLCLAL